MIEFLLERRPELFARLVEHLALTAGSVGLGVLIGVPLGALAARKPRLRGWVVGSAGILQTIPSLAMLSLLLVALAALPALPLIGRVRAIGATPALIALTLYALLPIIQNTVAGLASVPEAALEAADGLGMTANERLRLVELPLAMPVIVAGIRTAAVIGVGVATLAAFIGAGGLGEFINRGLYLSQHRLILLGAVPAAWLALALDQLLGWAEAALERGPGAAVERRRAGFRIALMSVPAAAFAAALAFAPAKKAEAPAAVVALRAAFTSEFIERPDGMKGLERAYGVRFSEVRDMEQSLMYDALSRGAVDVISAYGTDGRIPVHHVRLLQDDRAFFPPYEAAPVARQDALRRIPGLDRTLELLAGRLDDERMRTLNHEVDDRKRSPAVVAREFLAARGLLGALKPAKDAPKLVIGTKAFTEGILLGHLMAELVETRLGVRVDRRFSLGGTMLVHDALRTGQIDVYAEYTGTALTAILGLASTGDRAAAYEVVSREYAQRFGCRWLKPFGFNNTYALGVRESDAKAKGWTKISDLR